VSTTPSNITSSSNRCSSSSRSNATRSIDSFSQLLDNPNDGKQRNDTDSNWMKTPPRTNWNVSDSSLKSIPSYYPPMISTNCTYVSDASPSMVAARIAHCLKMRSLIAEYDDEKANATVFGMDTGSFGINLYKGSKSGPGTKMGPEREIPQTYCSDGGIRTQNTTSNSNTTVETVQPDFSHGVVIECTRIQGDVIVFHRNCQAILASARGESDGVDEFKFRRPFGVLLTSRFGFSDIGVDASWNQMKEEIRGGGGGGGGSRNRMRREEEKDCEDNNECDIIELLVPPPFPSPGLSPPSASVSSSRTNMNIPAQQSDVARSVCTALEIALSRLEFDNRLDLQLLGLQSLVLLTDVRSSRLEKAYLSSLCVLGSPMNHTASLEMNYSPNSLDCGGVREDEESLEGPLTNLAIMRIHERIRGIIMQQECNIMNPSPSGEDLHQHRDYPSSCLSTEDAPSFSSSSCAVTKSQQENPELHLSLRRTAVQSFSNALSTILSYSDRFPLLPSLHCETLHCDKFIKCLAFDLTGAARPPMAMMAIGLGLGCAHDAALAARLLQLIIRYDSSGNMGKIASNKGSKSFKNSSGKNIGDTTVGNHQKKLSDLLERARVAGLSCHSVLGINAERVLKNLATGGKPQLR